MAGIRHIITKTVVATSASPSRGLILNPDDKKTKIVDKQSSGSNIERATKRRAKDVTGGARSKKQRS